MRKNYILLAGLKYNNNLGDPAILFSTKEMVRETIDSLDIPNMAIKEMDMAGRAGKEWSAKNFIRNVCMIPIKIRQLIGNRFLGKKKAKRRFAKERIQLSCLLNISKEVSAILFVGGGIIKFKYEEFFIYLDVITQFAEKRNIPVMLSAVGIEGYDEDHPDCRLLKKILNRKCIKTITTRDDLECLQKRYLNKNDVITAQVADPACSFSRFFPLRTADQKNCIGLGVVRERLFEDNDVAFSKEEMLKLWSELYMNLLNKGYDCKLFCNGALSDFRFLEKLREYIADRYHITPDYVPRPETVEELTGILCSCKGVIVARLHASILSYAYDIPCVSLVWNHKQTMFGEQTGHEQFFITSKDFHADLIIERLIDAMAQKPDPVSKQKYCSTTQKYIENFLAEYCR